VRYQDNCSTGIGQPAQATQQLIGFRRREHRRWFVKNEDFCIPRQDLQQLEALLSDY
jgi:hypothetical protein